MLICWKRCTIKRDYRLTYSNSTISVLIDLYSFLLTNSCAVYKRLNGSRWFLIGTEAALGLPCTLCYKEVWVFQNMDTLPCKLAPPPPSAQTMDLDHCELFTTQFAGLFTALDRHCHSQSTPPRHSLHPSLKIQDGGRSPSLNNGQNSHISATV